MSRSMCRSCSTRCWARSSRSAAGCSSTAHSGWAATHTRCSRPARPRDRMDRDRVSPGGGGHDGWRRFANASSACTPTTVSSRRCSTRAAWNACKASLADLGVSSMQFDAEGAGFSFRRDEPLDMRMDQSTGPTAADLVDQAGRGSAGQRDLPVRRGAVLAPDQPRAGGRARPIATTASGWRRSCGARCRPGVAADRSGDAHVPGVADLGQRRTGRTRRVRVRRRATGSSRADALR